MHDAIQYARTRLLTLKLSALLAFMMLASWMLWPDVTALRRWMVASVIVNLVVFFRIWDDLADREIDRREHPYRVLCRTARTTWAVGMMVVALVVALILVSSSPPAVAVILGLILLLAYWYRWRNAVRGVANYHVILTKYPLTLLAVAFWLDDFPARLTLALLGLYLSLCILEVVHDQRLRKIAAVRKISMAEAVMLLMLAGWLLVGVTDGADAVSQSQVHSNIIVAFFPAF
jgi:hypothetical protein